MNRAELLEHLQPALDDLVDRITAMLPDLVRAELVATLGKLTGDAQTGQAKKPGKVAQRDPKPVKVAKVGARKPNSCSKCGATGFTAATCGKTHNVTPTTSAPVTSPAPSRLPPKAASASSGDVGLNKVVSFTF